MSQTPIVKAAVFWVGAVAILSVAEPVQDWPQWRGPNRDGMLSAFIAPETWPETLKLQWRKTVGLGHSSPVVAGGKIYVFARQEEQEVASSLDLSTGRILWREPYSAPYTMNSAATSHGKGPKSTPVIADGRLFTLGISGILSCFDAATGELRWRKGFADEFARTSPLYGAAMSMMVDGDLLIAHVGGHGDGALMAFHTQTGEVRWSWKEDGPGYASPVLVELEGSRQIVTQTEQHLVGVAAATGDLLWRVPFTTAYVQNIVTPIAYRDSVVFSGLSKGTFALRPRRGTNGWEIETLWENQDVSMYMSSPVIMNDMLFGLSHRRKGQFFCLDARTGATQWVSEGREGDNAALLGTGGLLFALTTDAELIVARAAGEGFDIVQKYTVAERPTWAHPVIFGNRVLIKDESSLALWKLD